MSKRLQSDLVSALVIAIAIFFYRASLSIKVDGSYPRYLCIGLIVCAVITIVQTEIEHRREMKTPHHELTEDEMTTEELAEKLAAESTETVPWQDLLAIFIISFVSLILWKPISFVLAGAAAIFALSVYKRRPVVKSVILAVVTVVVIQLIFRNIFTIPIPSPDWWPRF